MTIQLDNAISVDKDVFALKTKKQQLEWLKGLKHIKSTAQANKLLKGVACKPLKKKEDGV